MTHKEQLIAMLQSINNQFREVTNLNHRHPECKSAIEVEGTPNPNNLHVSGCPLNYVGYLNFESVWLFREDGSLIATGAYE